MLFYQTLKGLILGGTTWIGLFRKEDMTETITNVFEKNEIRSVWNAEEEAYYFSVVDVVNALANPKDAWKYWSVLKNRLKAKDSEVTTNCSQLKMLAPDGKMRMRDAMKTVEILRLIESMPSSKAKVFRIKWHNYLFYRIATQYDTGLPISVFNDFIIWGGKILWN